MSALEGLFIGAAMFIPCALLLCAAIWAMDDSDDSIGDDTDDSDNNY